jgi:hypothetical protein
VREGGARLRCARVFEKCVAGMRSRSALHFAWEKLVREQGAGSGERGVGISSPNDLKFW